MQTTPTAAAHRSVAVPLHRTLPRLARQPVRGLMRIGRDCAGTLARLNLGVIRPYLATHPEHVRQIVTDLDTYQREGMLWKDIQRLEGDGFAGEGAPWRRSRRMLQPLLSARSVTSYQATMAAAVTEALEVLGERAAGGRPFDLIAEMTRITHRVLIRVFFSNRITMAEAQRLGIAISTGLSSLNWRMMLPFVSTAVPLPGDRAFARSVGTIHRIIDPLIQAERAQGERGGDHGTDLLARFVHAVDEHGVPLEEKRVRDDVVSMFVAGTETTAMTLTWLFLLLDQHPAVAERLSAEAADVVGDGPLRAEQVNDLLQIRMTLRETLRVFPSGWLIPRQVMRPATLGGTALPPGAIVLLSPLLTHRLTEFWDDPDEFRPERFGPDQDWRRHRFAYIPFSAGAHQCLGDHFSLVEAQLAVAGILGRYRTRIVGPASLEPRLAPVLQPRRRPQMVLVPASRRPA